MKRALLISTSFITIIVIIASLNLLPELSLNSVSKLYGLDYLTIFLVLTAQTLLEKKNKYAFIFYITGNVVNIGLGYLIESPVVIAFSFVGIVIMIKNFKKWNEEENEKNTT